MGAMHKEPPVPSKWENVRVLAEDSRGITEALVYRLWEEFLEGSKAVLALKVVKGRETAASKRYGEELRNPIGGSPGREPFFKRTCRGAKTWGLR